MGCLLLKGTIVTDEHDEGQAQPTTAEADESGEAGEAACSPLGDFATAEEFRTYVGRLYEQVIERFQRQRAQAEQHAAWRSRLSQVVGEYVSSAVSNGWSREEIQVGLLAEVARASEAVLETLEQYRAQPPMMWSLSSTMN